MFQPVFFCAFSPVFFGGMRVRISDYAGRDLCGFGGFVRGARSATNGGLVRGGHTGLCIIRRAGNECMKAGCARPIYEVRCAGSSNSHLIDPAINIAV